MERRAVSTLFAFLFCRFALKNREEKTGLDDFSNFLSKKRVQELVAKNLSFPLVGVAYFFGTERSKVVKSNKKVLENYASNQKYMLPSGHFHLFIDSMITIWFIVLNKKRFIKLEPKKPYKYFIW